MVRKGLQMEQRIWLDLVTLGALLLISKAMFIVADRSNYAIRKISTSGVSTIAGGLSKAYGHQDGPAQNASFSSDFELTFVPSICALLVADHGNQLVRQIDLKPEDCARDSHSVVGSAAAWILGWAFSCLVCLFIGIAIRPYIIRHEVFNLFHFSVTWRHCLINPVKQVVTLCFDIRSVVVSSPVYAFSRRLFWLVLSHLSLMFRLNYVEAKTLRKDVSSCNSSTVHDLLDSSNLNSCEVTKSQKYADQLKDLISFDDSLTEDVLKQENGKQETCDILFDCQRKLNDLIQTNMKDFVGVAEGETPPLMYKNGSSGLNKRR